MPTPGQGSSFSSVPFTDDDDINSLIYGTKWSNNVITYSFPWTVGPSHFANNYSTVNEHLADVTFGVTSDIKQAIVDGFALWASVADIEFIEVNDTASEVGVIRAAFSSALGDEMGWAAFPSSYPKAGDIWVHSDLYSESWTPGEYPFFLGLHEIGHAIGLDHPFENTILSSNLDHQNYTVMSYNTAEKSFYPKVTAGAWESYWIYPETPMILDIAAIQEIYGANYSYNDDNTTYTIDDSKPFFRTIWDGGGKDTIDASGFTTRCNINLNGGEYSSFYFPPATNTGGETPTYDGTNALGIAFDCIIENATAGSGSDTILGNNVGNILKGKDGDDRIWGGNGNDRLYGGDNDDKLYGGSGNDRSYGEDGNDSLFMDTGNDTLDGGSGTDWLYIRGSENSKIDLRKTTGQNTGYGTDIIKNIENASGGSGDDEFYGTSDNNTLEGNNGNDLLYSGDGDDKLYGGGGSDRSYGGAGNDSLFMDTGNDTLDGGSGTDWLYVQGSVNSKIDLRKTTGQNTGYGTDIIKNIENASGGSGDDRFHGTSVKNTLKGNEGNDLLYSGDGDDKLYGGAGDDASYGEKGNDDLYMDAGNDTLDGGAGTDWLHITGDTKSFINLGITTAQNTGYGTDIIRNVEHVSGSSAADVIYGNSGKNILKGKDGSDFLSGKSGDDTFYGGTGNDKAYGGTGDDSFYMDAGNDTLDGGSGEDWIYLVGIANSTVNLDRGHVQTTGFGTDLIVNIEHASGGSGSDKFYGTAGNNKLMGNKGNDILFGRAGNDSIYGGNNNDKLFGDSGNDKLYCGTGDDTIDGGDDKDTAYIGIGGNTLVDFESVTIAKDGDNLLIYSDEIGENIFTNVESFVFNDVTKSYTSLIMIDTGDTPKPEIPGVKSIGDASDDVMDGSDGDDTIASKAGDDSISAGAGDDRIAASDGNDTVDGDSGDDMIGGGLGNDSISGGTGHDTIGSGDGNDTVDGGDGDDMVAAGRGDDTVSGGDGDDRLAGSVGEDSINGDEGEDNIGGGYNDDTIHGGTGNDTVGAGQQDDVLYGDEGDDVLNGNWGHDTIYGGDGNDTIAGGDHNDVMTGGNGADVFKFRVFNANTEDRITDFTRGEDLLEMRGSFAGLNISNHADGLQVEKNGHVIILEDVTDLFADDFNFV